MLTPAEKHHIVGSFFEKEVGSRRCNPFVPVTDQNDPLLRIHEGQYLR
jgi:hypothetical protein